MWLVSKITDFLVDENMTEDDRSIIQYGLERIIENLIGCIILVLIGWGFGSPLQGLLLWIFLYPLRSNAGGYHASTRGRCVLISTIAVFAAFVFWHEFHFRLGIHMVICLVSALAIWFLAPVGSRNKPLDEKEKNYYRKRVRHILVFELFLASLAVWMQWMDVFMAIEMACLVVGVSVCVGKRGDY